MSYRPSKADLVERPQNPESLVRGFHGRPMQGRHRFIMPDFRLNDAQCVGRSETIFYLSDKRDPNDPKGEGAQGFLKRFYHDQGPSSYLYVIGGDLDPFECDLIANAKRSGMTRRAQNLGLKPKGKWPSTIVELGDLEEVHLKNGNDEVEISFNNYGLFVWDNMKTLMGISRDLPPSKVFLWSSSHTHVNWRGIID